VHSSDEDEDDMEGPDDIEDVERLVDEDEDGDVDLGDVDVDVSVEEILGSDDSVDDGGEEGGIVMRKTERAAPVAWGRVGEGRKVVRMQGKGVREELD
jgi:hypothetical protein